MGDLIDIISVVLVILLFVLVVNEYKKLKSDMQVLKKLNDNFIQLVNENNTLREKLEELEEASLYNFQVKDIFEGTKWTYDRQKQEYKVKCIRGDKS